MDATAAAAPAPFHVPWWLVLLQGIALVIIGVLLLTQTNVTLFTLVVLLGVYWLIGGIFDIIGIFLDQSQWGWKLFTGVIGILAGIVILRHPAWATVVVPLTLVWILGAVGLVIGVVGIVRAFMGGGWGVGILGVLSIVLGIILLANPLESTLVLVYAVAIWAIIGGIAAIVFAFRLRAPAGQPQPQRPATA